MANLKEAPDEVQLRAALNSFTDEQLENELCERLKERTIREGIALYNTINGFIDRLNEVQEGEK